MRRAAQNLCGMHRIVLPLALIGTVSLVTSALAAPAVLAPAPVTGAPAAPADPIPANPVPVDPAPLTGPEIGRPAPPFTLRTLEGKTVTLDSFRGKTLVLNVWATWCPPCREEMPDLIKSYAPLHKSGVEFLGVDTTEEAPIVRAYAVAKGLPYPQAVVGAKAFQTAYDIQYFPTTFVIDPQGILRARNIDVIAPSELTQFVADAKAGRNSEHISPLQAKIDALLAGVDVPSGGDAATLVAAAKAADAAISKAEDMLGDGDPAKGTQTDLLRTQVEEAALRDRAIAALTKVAASDADKALLARLQGDGAKNREQWADAFAFYSTVVRLEPKNEDGLSGLAFAASRLGKRASKRWSNSRSPTPRPPAIRILTPLSIRRPRSRKRRPMPNPATRTRRASSPGRICRRVAPTLRPATTFAHARRSTNCWPGPPSYQRTTRVTTCTPKKVRKRSWRSAWRIRAARPCRSRPGPVPNYRAAYPIRSSIVWS
jgi:thiol-disulfide isomerase/thioredoxin